MSTRKTRKIILFGDLFYLIVLTYAVLNTIHSELRPGLKLDAESAIYMFNRVQTLGFNDHFIILDILPLLLIPALSSFYAIFIKNNNELNNVIQRIGYRRYLKKSVIQIFVVASLFALIIKIYEMALINWFYYPFVFVKHSLIVNQHRIFQLTV